MKPKFKIGDLVTLKHDDRIAIVIVEIHTITCYGGTQINYRGPLYRNEVSWIGTRKELKERTARWNLTTSRNEQFTEPELKKVVEGNK